MIVAISPLTGATKDIFTIKGIRVYEILILFFMFLLPMLFYEKNLHRIIFFTSVFLIFITMHSLLLGQSLYDTLYCLRELFWYSVGIVIGASAYEYATIKNAFKVYVFLYVVYIFYAMLAATVFYPLFIGFQDDVLVGESDENLRISFESLVALIWLSTYLLTDLVDRNKYFHAILLMASTYYVVVLSSSRTLLAVYFLCVSYVIIRRYLLVGIFVVVSLITFGILFLQFMLPDSNRFTFEYQIYSWVARNSPFVEKVLAFNWLDFIIGKGFGETFYISWFEEAGLNQNARNIDGQYQTLFVKVGIVGVLFYLFYHIYLLIKLINFDSKLSKSLIVIISSQLFIACTTSYLFRISAVYYGFTIGLTLMLVKVNSHRLSSKYA
jgi:hypothetical protein